MSEGFRIIARKREDHFWGLDTPTEASYEVKLRFGDKPDKVYPATEAQYKRACRMIKKLEARRDAYIYVSRDRRDYLTFDW